MFSKNLRQARTKLGLSAEELARKINLSRSYITLIESGKRIPRKSLLFKIAKALEVDKKVVVGWYLEDISHKIEKDPDNS